MKRTMLVLFFVIVVIGLLYYFTLVRESKVKDSKLLKIKNQESGILISTMESSKYLSNYDLQLVNDTTVSINVYTTSIYNVFASKTADVAITLDKGIKNLIIAGKTIERNSLLTDY